MNYKTLHLYIDKRVSIAALSFVASTLLSACGGNDPALQDSTAAAQTAAQEAVWEDYKLQGDEALFANVERKKIVTAPRSCTGSATNVSQDTSADPSDSVASSDSNQNSQVDSKHDDDHHSGKSDKSDKDDKYGHGGHNSNHNASFNDDIIDQHSDPMDQNSVHDADALELPPSNPVVSTEETLPAPSGNQTQACYADKYVQPEQTNVDKVDILFVTDTSGSLNGERKQIAAAVDSFVQQLPEKIHYRMGVMLAHGSRSSWSGRLYKFRNEPFTLDSEKMTSDQIRQSLSAKLANPVSDVYSDGGEEGIFSFNKSIMNPKKRRKLQRHQFYRKDAALVVIFISDENDICAVYPKGVIPVYDGDHREIPAKKRDCSAIGSIKKALNRIHALKKKQPVLLSGLVYTNPNTVPKGGENEYGYGYMDLIKMSNGIAVDLADKDFKQSMRLIGRRATEKMTLQTEFKLASNQVDVSTLSVLVDNKPVTFSYNKAINEVRLDNAGRAKSKIQVNYCDYPVTSPGTVGDSSGSGSGTTADGGSSTGTDGTTSDSTSGSSSGSTSGTGTTADAGTTSGSTTTDPTSGATSGSTGSSGTTADTGTTQDSSIPSDVVIDSSGTVTQSGDTAIVDVVDPTLPADDESVTGSTQIIVDSSTATTSTSSTTTDTSSTTSSGTVTDSTASGSTSTSTTSTDTSSTGSTSTGTTSTDTTSTASNTTTASEGVPIAEDPNACVGLECGVFGI